MTEYHVGCGAFDIYAGTLNKSKTMWTRKNKVTDEVISAAAEYLLRNDKGFLFTDTRDGKRYRMCVVEADEQMEGEDNADN